MSYRESKLNACFMPRAYNAQPRALTASILKPCDEVEDLNQDEREEHPLIRIKEIATPGEYHRVWSSCRWRREIQA